MINLTYYNKQKVIHKKFKTRVKGWSYIRNKCSGCFWINGIYYQGV